jgi:hypothetical protein
MLRTVSILRPKQVKIDEVTGERDPGEGGNRHVVPLLPRTPGPRLMRSELHFAFYKTDPYSVFMLQDAHLLSLASSPASSIYKCILIEI